MDLSPLDNGHGAEVFLLAGPVRQSGIPPGYFQACMPEQLLEDFKPHPGIKELAGKGVPERV